MAEILFGDEVDRKVPECTEPMQDRIALHATFESVIKLRAEVAHLTRRIDGYGEIERYLAPEDASIRTWIMACTKRASVETVALAVAVALLYRLGQDHPIIAGVLFLAGWAWLAFWHEAVYPASAPPEKKAEKG